MIGQAIADGVLTGSILALGTIGISFSLQILRFANFSHSELLTWGAYLALAFVTLSGVGVPFSPLSFGWQMLLAIMVAALGTAVVALAANALVFKPLRTRGAHHLSLVFASFGVALILRSLVLLLWGPEVKYYSRALQMAVE